MNVRAEVQEIRSFRFQKFSQFFLSRYEGGVLIKGFYRPKNLKEI